MDSWWFISAGIAFIVGKIALGLRADYLAIATLLIAEIIVSIIKHEDWLARGVKNVIGLKDQFLTKLIYKVRHGL